MTRMPRGSADNPQSAFDRHFGDVYGYVAYRLAPDPEAAQEVTQEVFLAALESWSSYRGDSSLLSWLRAIARHKVADHFRLKAQRTGQTEPCDLAAVPAPGLGEPLDRVVLLAQVMRSLPTESVELLEEKYLEGLSIRQMAHARGRSEKSVESALARAREMLKDRLVRLEARQEHADELRRH